MADLSTARRQLRAARTTREKASEVAESATVRVAEANTRLILLRRSGATPAQLRDAKRVLTRAENQQAKALDTATEARRSIERLRTDLFKAATPESLVSQMDGQIPIVMFPVRLETRYSQDRKRLHIRIFPDASNVHSHEAALTELELNHGKDYWNIVRSGTAADQARAWSMIAGRRGAPRARYIVDVTTPTNVAMLGTDVPPVFPSVPLKTGPWTLPLQTVALPDRFLAVGFRGDAPVFSKWGEPVPDDLPHGPQPDPTGQVEFAEDDLPVDEGMRWMLEYGEAEKVGMAITIGPNDHGPGRVVGAIDQLFVIGLDVTLPPEQGALRIESLFSSHLHTEGTEFLKPGTPTNNTSRVQSGYHSSPISLEAALDPAATTESEPKSSARNLAAALGLDSAAFDDVPNADMADQGPAGDMNDALWEASWGYYFDHLLHPSVTDAQAADLRSHYRDFVRARGPLPAMRIGDQPYGFLPVQAFAKWSGQPGQSTEATVALLLNNAKGFWVTAASRSPRIGRTNDPDADLLDVLRFTARSSSFRFRSVMGGEIASNLDGFGDVSARSEAIGQLLLATLHVENTPLEITYAVTRSLHRRLSIPTVQRENLSETDRLVDNYITQIAARVRKEGGLDEFHQRSFWFDSNQLDNLSQLRLDDIRQVIVDLKSPPLLEALLGHAATIEIAKASARLLDKHEVATGIKDARATKVIPAEIGLVDTESQVKSLLQLTEAKARSIAGNKTLGAFLATAQLHQRPETRPLNDFLQALRRLAKLPSAELERLLLDTIDTAGTRLDAWVTSFATKRLSEVRKLHQRESHIGAFGWVENLRPDETPDSLGYVHAPSLPQAATAAVLRSGHLSHRETDSQLLNLDLSSERVRVALKVLDGARQGQRVTALLGYRFERSIRERDIELAKYILPFRVTCPLATSVDGEPGQQIEAVAARDVVDGLKLLERFGTDQAKLLDEVNVTDPTDRAALTEELERLDSVRDAVSDVLVAEGVYQTVLGNTERAGAALASIDQQSQPVEPEFVSTPRTGTTYTHRVMVLMQATDTPPDWTAHDLRARCAPRVNHWVGVALGDPKRIRFAADVMNKENHRIRGVELTLADLGLSPLAVMAATARGGRNNATELEERVAAAMTAQISSADAASLVLLPGRLASWPSTSVGFTELMATCSALSDVVSGSRPADARDQAVPGDNTPAGINVAELAARADMATTEVEGAQEDLGISLNDGLADGLRSAIARASEIGSIGVMSAASGSSVQDTESLTETARAAFDTLTAIVTRFGESPPSTPAELVAHYTDRLKTIFGEDFPVLPVFVAGSPAELTATLENHATLVGEEVLAATTWLHRIGHVQTHTERLWNLLNRSEIASGGLDATQLHIMQLPHDPQAAWLALPFNDNEPVDAEVSIVMHSPHAIDYARGMAGVVVDDWVETIPGKSELTGVSFHYDAPGSRPPQTVLVAVPPSPATKQWSVDLVLDTIRETLDLTKVRSADPAMVPHIGRFLPALYFAQNAAGTTPTVNFSALQNLQDALEQAEREQ